MPFRPGRSASLLYIAGAYVVAVAVAWWGFHGVDANPQVAMAAGLLASMAVIFVFTVHADNGSVFDAWWSVLPPFAALYMVGLEPGGVLAALDPSRAGCTCARGGRI